MFDECEPAKSICVASPCLSKPEPEYDTWLHEAGIELLRHGIGIETIMVSRDPYIDRARNSLVTRFLEGQSTDLLFIDVDVHSSADAILQIALATKPFVGGVYPKKKIRADAPLEYPVDLLPGLQKSENGLLEVAMVPTGFLRLNRKVFDLMPCEVYDSDQGVKQLGFFESRIENGRYRGEDIRFCEEWRRRGGKIWAMTQLRFGHTGPFTWFGCLHDWLMENCCEAPGV